MRSLINTNVNDTLPSNTSNNNADFIQSLARQKKPAVSVNPLRPVEETSQDISDIAISINEAEDTTEDKK